MRGHRKFGGRALAGAGITAGVAALAVLAVPWSRFTLKALPFGLLLYTYAMPPASKLLFAVNPTTNL